MNKNWIKQPFLLISASVIVLEGLIAGVALAQPDRYGAIATSISGVGVMVTIIRLDKKPNKKH